MSTGVAATQGGALLIIWVTFTAVALVGIVAVFVWAVRARQFADQDRARYLPLRSGIVVDEATPDGGTGHAAGAAARSGEDSDDVST